MHVLHCEYTSVKVFSVRLPKSIHCYLLHHVQQRHSCKKLDSLLLGRCSQPVNFCAAHRLPITRLPNWHNLYVKAKQTQPSIVGATLVVALRTQPTHTVALRTLMTLNTSFHS